jgi:hypothetical protein
MKNNKPSISQANLKALARNKIKVRALWLYNQVILTINKLAFYQITSLCELRTYQYMKNIQIPIKPKVLIPSINSQLR